jgi:hypothetical protein
MVHAVGAFERSSTWPSSRQRRPRPRRTSAEADDDHDAHDHGEAPWPIVVALTVTAGLTVLLFFFPGVPLALAKALVGGAP